MKVTSHSHITHNSCLILRAQTLPSNFTFPLLNAPINCVLYSLQPCYIFQQHVNSIKLYWRHE
jgi:hypothetical protein